MSEIVNKYSVLIKWKKIDSRAMDSIYASSPEQACAIAHAKLKDERSDYARITDVEITAYPIEE